MCGLRHAHHRSAPLWNTRGPAQILLHSNTDTNQDTAPHKYRSTRIRHALSICVCLACALSPSLFLSCVRALSLNMAVVRARSLADAPKPLNSMCTSYTLLPTSYTLHSTPCAPDSTPYVGGQILERCVSQGACSQGPSSYDSYRLVTCCLDSCRFVTLNAMCIAGCLFPGTALHTFALTFEGPARGCSIESGGLIKFTIPCLISP